MQVIQQGDSVFSYRYYHKTGPMIKVETYSDAVLTIPYGRFCGYDGKGKPDRTGKVSKVIKDGYRSYYDDSL